MEKVPVEAAGIHDSTRARERKLFYGYYIVGAGFLISLLSFGVFDSFGVFFKEISSELGSDRATTSGAFSLAFLLLGFVSLSQNYLPLSCARKGG